MEESAGLKTRHNNERCERERTGLKTCHYRERQGGVKQETIRAQNYQGWEQLLRKIYPPMPRTAPAPLPKTLHGATNRNRVVWSI
jgi:hypothetical protein